MNESEVVSYIGKELLDVYPYNCIGVVTKKIEDNVFSFTGTLIAKNLVLTSAMAVYNSNSCCISSPEEISFNLLSSVEQPIKAKRISGCQNYAKLYENQIINKTQETLLPLNDFAIFELEKENDNITVFPNLKIVNTETDSKISILGYFNLNHFIEKSSNEYKAMEEIFTKNELNHDDIHLFNIKTDFILENCLIIYLNNEMNHFYKGGPIFLIDEDKKLINIIGNNQDQGTGCPVSEEHFKAIKRLSESGDKSGDEEHKKFKRKALMDSKSDLKSFRLSKFVYKTQNTFDKSFHREKSEKNEKLFRKILDKEKSTTKKLDNIPEKNDSETIAKQSMSKIVAKQIEKNLLQNKTMTPSMYKKSVLKINYNNNKSKEKDKEKDVKKTVRTPTNLTNTKNNLNNNNIKVNKQNLNNVLLKSTTINPKCKKPEKQSSELKTDRKPKKGSAQIGPLNASWNINPKERIKKEESKASKMNLNKSPIKLKKKNSKTPRGDFSKKNLFEVTRSKEIDKDFLQSLTGNLQSLISNIEVMEKSRKKNNEIQIGK